MKKKITILIFIITSFVSYSEIKMPDYNIYLSVPFSNEINIPSDQSSDKTTYSFKIGKIDGDISLFGFWKLKLGYGTGFVTYPLFEWILNVPNMKYGVIFEQERVFALDWVTDNGIYLHLFFNDDINATEYTFKYQLGKIFNGLYITNKFNGLEVNPYRSLKGGKAQDVNFGFDWQYKFYKGRFDVQFDSVKKVSDTFKGNKKIVSNKFLSSQYIRGIYYYLPDTKIIGALEVYVSDQYGELFSDLPSSFTEERRYKLLKENIDFKINPVNGFITFKESVYGKSVLIYYQTNVNGYIYDIGNPNCGRKGFHGTADFNKTSYPSYFTSHNGKDYFILNFQKAFSDFEEKNSYKISSPGSKISNLNFDIFNDSNLKLNGFSGVYDEFGGCLRIIRNATKGLEDNVYPFYNYETDPSYFYISFNSPADSVSKSRIDYSCYISGQGMKLTSKPVEASILVLLNSVQLAAGQYSYDYISQTLTVNIEINDTDIIEVYYVTDEQDAYNLTASLKNDFRLNDYLIIGDSFWYKMPLKLWEDSYYFKLHSMEFMYNIHLTGDFKKLLKDKNGKFGFDSNATFSLFQPELKGITIVEDFEYQLKGLALDLDYKNWFPVNYPSLPGITGYGKLFYRNTHKYGIKTNNSYISIYDNPPSREEYADGANIGPYSSSDGHYGEKNSLSLITEFELEQNQAISVAIPLNEDKNNDYSVYSEFVAAIKAINLTGTVGVYVDAGETTEKFYLTDSLVQKETLDEGLRYFISGGNYYMYKGKNDGINSTNDFNLNGILDADGNISNFSNTDTTNDHVDNIQDGYQKIVNFKILNYDYMKNIRSLRLTIYNTGAVRTSGKLLFNQLRFTETGWEYDKNLSSDATEIFPAEDNVLLNNTFSQKNPDFDKRLHNQRFRERTMRIRLKNNEIFSIRKKFINPVEISYFKKIGFFIMSEGQSYRTIKVTLKDTAGNEMIYQADLNGLPPTQWKQLEYLFDSMTGYNNSNKDISEIIIDFLNPGTDTTVNRIYLDEFYMDDSTPLVGFGTKQIFEYSEPGLDIKNNQGLSMFQSPSIKMITGFNIDNFLKNEMRPFKGYLIDNDVAASFKFITMDFFTQSYLNFVFKNNNFYNPAETFRFKISRYSTNQLPLLFTFYYDYRKSGIPDTSNNFILSTVTQQRHLLMEGGVQNKIVYFKTGYDIDTTIRTVSYNYNKLFGELKLSYLDINTRILYSLSNKRLRNFLNGIFSLDNLGFLFNEDFISFGYEGIEKNQEFEIHSGFNLIPEINFSNDIELKNKGFFQNYNSQYSFNTKYFDKAGINLKTEYKGERKIFFTLELSRTVENSFYKDYDTLQWYEYFSNFNSSIGYLTPIFFYPLFCSVFKKDDRYYFDNGTRFDLLNDNLKFTFDWSLYIDKRFFLPYKFSFNVIETITNTVVFTPAYNFITSLYCKGESANEYLKKIDLEYFVTENIGIRKGENDYKTLTGLILGLYLYNSLNIETTLNYDIDYTEGLYKKEFHHSVSFKTKIYKEFFKKNFITDDKSGIELTFLTEVNSNFYQRLDAVTEMIDNPIRIYFTPGVGYRFNKNITLKCSTMYGYSVDYSQKDNYQRHNFGFEFSIEGIFSF